MKLENQLSFTPILISYFHFSKNGSESESGIEHIYHDPCQDWMDLINMKLTSPNYPEPYNPLEHCTWKITAPHGHYITLEFEIIAVIIFIIRLNLATYIKSFSSSTDFLR